MTKLHYLATPYAAHGSGRIAAFYEACDLASRLLAAGVMVFSPIAHGHAIADYATKNPFGEAEWRTFDLLFAPFCDSLIVGHLDGWERSEGIASEIERFARDRKPIFDCDPLSLTMTKRCEVMA